MRRSILKLLTIVAVMGIFVCQSAFANTVGATAEVTMPTAHAIKATMTEVNSHLNDDPTDDTWGTPRDITAGADINFNDHEMVETDGIFTTGYYYVIDIAPDGGGWGGSGVTFAYTEGTNDIGHHATATLVECVYDPEKPQDPTENDIAKYGLYDMNRTVSIDNFDDGWLRVYIGLATGDDNTSSNPEVTPFVATNATPPGDYSGTLTISYTGT